MYLPSYVLFLDKFKMIKSSAILRTITNSSKLINNGFDPSQLSQMKSHKLLLVNTDDEIIGTASKWQSHQIQTAALHRAFSLFLFNHDRTKLLLQKRSAEKITFPNLWTNTCCSHPRITTVDDGSEDILKNEEKNGICGVKLAAGRRLDFELNIKLQNESVNFNFLTKILYQAQNSSCNNFIEKELDYILDYQLDKNFEIPDPNFNEVREVDFCTFDEICGMDSCELTPWFRMILENGLLEKMFCNEISGLKDKIINFNYKIGKN